MSRTLPVLSNPVFTASNTPMAPSTSSVGISHVPLMQPSNVERPTHTIEPLHNGVNYAATAATLPTAIQIDTPSSAISATDVVELDESHITPPADITHESATQEVVVTGPIQAPSIISADNTSSEISTLMPHNSHSMVTRSKAGVFKPKLYQVCYNDTPSTVHEALADPS
ncbi:hypothetical protein V6N12_011660 [Hibiscus sabdariffa]|uniref:Uncharacterized protein n=1 Tax=Hibiscus sabdariffa TaxID=183260 RepID=A0ABR2B5R4_9ROSI